MMMVFVTMVAMVFSAVVVRTAVMSQIERFTLGVSLVMVVMVSVIMVMVVMMAMIVIVSMVVVVVMVIRWGATAIDAHSTNLRISSRGPIFSPMSL